MNLTAQQLHNAIGQVHIYPINGLDIHVRITDAKMSYGVPRLLIQPVEGSGSTWVNANSLRPYSQLID